MKNSLVKFAKAYIKSMRLYYAFITGIAGWLGASFYIFTTNAHYPDVQVIPPTEKQFVIIVFLFLSWGINQIFNDFLGIKEDRVNAPHRPMVTGDLNAKAALTVSICLMIFVGFVTYFYLEPIALIPMLLGVALNILYEYAKGYGILGNIVFGLMITMCCAYGFLASGPAAFPIFTPDRIAVISVVWLMNSLMTYYTYFKDYEGDKLAGKNTIVVKYGIEKAKWIGVFSSFLPAVVFIAIYLSGFMTVTPSTTFWVLAALTFCLEVWTGYLYYKNPVGEKTYDSLAANFRACACGQAAFVALFNDQLALILFLLSYIFVGFLFGLHKNREA